MLDVGDVLLGRRVGVRAGLPGVGPGGLAGGALERRREEQRLAVVGGQRDDPVDGGAEAHVEHPVGLVEDEHADVIEGDGAAADQVLEPARRRDQDVGLLRGGDLGAEADPAVDRGEPQLAGAGEAFELVDDLRGELARRRQDQGLGAVGAGLEDVDQRHAEGERLARSGRRLDEQVVAIERIGDDQLLYGEGLGDRPRAQRFDDRLGGAEFGKGSYEVLLELTSSGRSCSPEVLEHGEETGSLGRRSAPARPDNRSEVSLSTRK